MVDYMSVGLVGAGVFAFTIALVAVQEVVSGDSTFDMEDRALDPDSDQRDEPRNDNPRAVLAAQAWLRRA